MENAIIPKLFNSVLTTASRDHDAILPIYTLRINNADGSFKCVFLSPSVCLNLKINALARTVTAKIRPASIFNLPQSL